MPACKDKDFHEEFVISKRNAISCRDPAREENSEKLEIVEITSL